MRKCTNGSEQGTIANPSFKEGLFQSSSAYTAIYLVRSSSTIFLVSSDQSISIVEVETDAEGIKSSSLRSILENWPAEKPKPKILYTVPASNSFFPRFEDASNPTTVWM